MCLYYLFLILNVVRNALVFQRFFFRVLSEERIIFFGKKEENVLFYKLKKRVLEEFFFFFLNSHKIGQFSFKKTHPTLTEYISVVNIIKM